MRFVPFVKYAETVMRRDILELSYRSYVTDSLRLSGEGKYLPNRWLDSFSGKNAEIDVQATIDRLVDAGGFEVVE